VSASTARSLDDELALVFASDPAAMADPHPLWRRLREQHRVYRHEHTVLLTRYADIRELHRDSVHGSRRGFFEGTRAEAIRSSLPPDAQDAFDRVAAFQGLQVSRTEGDDHERLRRIAHRAFTPRRIADMRAMIQRHCDTLLDPLRGSHECDLMPFAYRFPLAVIADILSVPDEEGRDEIRSWGNRIARHFGSSDPALVIDAHRAIEEFRAYVGGVIARHRADPDAGSELVAALLGAEGEEQLSEDELAAMFVVLLFAGHETTTNLISIGLVELLRERDQWELLCREPDLVPGAVEELLRWVTPVQWEQRLVVEDVELGGALLERGQTVFTMLAGANRDPEVFEQADELDIRREDARKHLSFGHGPHFCLGASLARLEGEIAFTELTRRFPDIELAVDPGELVFQGAAMMRQLRALPVRLRPAA
jgi:cytochrome P450